LAIEGAGKIIGVGNGDPSSHEPDQFIASASTPLPVWQRSLFNGFAQIIVQSTKEPGDIKLTARTTGLAETTLPLTAKPVALRLAVPRAHAGSPGFSRSPALARSPDRLKPGLPTGVRYRCF